MAGKLTARVLLGIPTLSTARRSTTWIDGLMGLQMPLGSSLGRIWVEDKPIAEARNELCLAALNNGCEYLVMLGDDVIPPPNMLLQMLDKIGRTVPVDDREERISLLTGVYWTKTVPTEPYLWNGLLKGAHRDWVAGDLFPVDFAGCDALMIEMAALRRIPYPWFSTDWTWEEGQPVSSIATEDFFFYTRAREAGIRLFADTAIQCLHEERSSGQLFGLMTDMPQAGGTPPACPEQLVADIGAGNDSPYFGENARVIRFDARAEAAPDVQCDIRSIPEQHFGQYDVVHSRHVLEHFGRLEAPALLAHWAKLLRPGGEIIVRVPNIGHAIKKILDDEPDVYAWQQLYGGQSNELDVHKNGFTVRKLRGLFKTIPQLVDVEVIEEDDGLNLRARARLLAYPKPPALAPAWYRIEAGGQDSAQQESPVESQAPSSHGPGGPSSAASDLVARYPLTYLLDPSSLASEATTADQDRPSVVAPAAGGFSSGEGETTVSPSLPTGKPFPFHAESCRFCHGRQAAGV